MKKVNIKLILILTTFLLLNTRCKKFISVPPPITQLVTSSVFETDQTATAAMNGVYSVLESNQGFSDGRSGSVGFLTGLASDELTNYSAISDQIEFYQNNLTKNNLLLYDALWASPYRCIYQVNSIISGLEISSGVSNTVKTELTSEAKFVRAFTNFYLVNLFGNIPLITSTDYSSNAVAIQVSKDSVFLQIIKDLTDAQNYLASDYSYSAGERVRPNATAARALLARVYLFTGNWEKAESEATSVIDNSLYSLLPDLNQVFLANSNEAIWQLMPNAPGMNTGEGSIYILDSDPLYATLSPQLLNAFETGDQRAIDWIADTTIGTNNYHFSFKYKVKTGDAVTEYSMVLRLAEQYLIRSEARAHLNNLSGALDDLNVIRSRAGLSNISSTIQKEILDAILHERQVELFNEWGHRWLDLVRTGQATSVLSPIKSGWQSYDTLFPIPQSEILKDPHLTQNPGY